MTTLTEDEFNRQARAISNHVSESLDIDLKDISVASRSDGLLDADIPSNAVLQESELSQVNQAKDYQIAGRTYVVQLHTFELKHSQLVFIVDEV